jgi:phytoene dehydrogenase-like protein
MASLPCFHPEPEELSAAFVAWRLRRVTRRATAIRYVKGGWSTLAEALAAHARTLGVEIHLGSHVTELPASPVIVATSPNSAARLLGRQIRQHGSRVALLDIGLSTRPRRAPFAVLDLDTRTYLARYSLVDRSLAPAGACLIQSSAPMREGETQEQATSRLERSLDDLVPDWRAHIAWRRAALATDATGAIDPPGTQWHARPAIAQGNDVYLVGDYVAAPGMLAEVSFASALQAAKQATENSRARRRRSEAPAV